MCNEPLDDDACHHTLMIIDMNNKHPILVITFTKIFHHFNHQAFA